MSINTANLITTPNGQAELADHPPEGEWCLCEIDCGNYRDYAELKAGCNGWMDPDFGGYSWNEIQRIAFIK